MANSGTGSFWSAPPASCDNLGSRARGGDCDLPCATLRVGRIAGDIAFNIVSNQGTARAISNQTESSGV